VKGPFWSKSSAATC